MTKIVTKNFSLYNSKRSNIEKMFIKFKLDSDNKEIQIPVTELFTSKGKIKNVNHLKTMIANNIVKADLFTIIDGDTINLNSKHVDIIVNEINVPTKFVTSNLSKSTYGLTSVYKMKQNPLSKKLDSYLAIVLDGNITSIYAKKDEVYFYNGNKKVSFSYYIKNKNLKTLDFNKNWYYNNIAVSELLLEEEFSIDKSNKISEEKFDKDNLTIQTVQYTKTGKEKILDTKSLDRYFSIQTPVQIADPNDDTKTVSMISCENFEIAQNTSPSNYVRVTLQDSNKEVLVKIKDVKTLDGKSIDSKNLLNDYIGEQLKIKIDNNEYISKPLTAVEATLNYSPVYTFEKSNSTSPTENSYLKLKNGSFVKEKDVVEPISYSYTKDSDFDKVKFDSLLISKEYYEKIANKTDIIVLNGKKFNISAGEKLKRCALNDCDVIQTSSENNEIEKCSEMYRSTNGEFSKTSIILKDKVVKDIYDGKYKLNSVYFNKKVEELDPKANRYEYTNKHLVPDYAEDCLEYQSLVNSPLSFKVGKRKAKLQGGVKFDTSKAIKKFYTNWLRIGAVSLLASLSLGGILVVAVAPVLVAAFVASMVALPIFAPIFLAIKGAIKNRTKKLKDKTKYNKKIASKHSSKEIENLQDSLKSKLKKPLSKDERLLLSKNLIQKYSLVKQNILSLSKTQNKAEFVMKDGKAIVTRNNAKLAGQFTAELNKEIRLRNKLKGKKHKYDKLSEEIKKFEKTSKTKKVEKLKKKRLKFEEANSRYNKANDIINERTKNYVYPVLPEELDKHKKLETQLENLENVKNLALVKINAEELTLNDKEKKILKKLTYNTKKHRVEYKGKAYNENKEAKSKKKQDILSCVKKVREKMASFEGLDVNNTLQTTVNTNNTRRSSKPAKKPTVKKPTVKKNKTAITKKKVTKPVDDKKEEEIINS